MSVSEAQLTATGVALGLGSLAKQAAPFPDRFIPALVAVAGAVIVPALSGWTALNVVSGLQAGLAATGVNQAYRQTQKPE